MHKVGDKFFNLSIKSNLDGSTDRFYSTSRIIFICDCGSDHISTLNNVKRGNTKFCLDCSKKRKSKLHKTHGHSMSRKDKDPLGHKCYYTWQAMKRRCYYEKDNRFSEYGGRGIVVCDRWKYSYENFLEDMGLPNDNDSIERIDVNGNYEPLNCKWIPISEQSSNRRNNRNITAFGKTMILTEWAKETGIKRETIARRLNAGWSAEKALAKKV